MGFAIYINWALKSVTKNLLLIRKKKAKIFYEIQQTIIKHVYVLFFVLFVSHIGKRVSISKKEEKTFQICFAPICIKKKKRERKKSSFLVMFI